MTIIESQLRQKRLDLIAEMQEIDLALRHIADGTYGICTKCGQTIEPARLKVFPTARQCRECKDGFEQRRGIVGSELL